MEELLGYGRADPPAGVFVDVSAGRSRTCGVRDDGALVCWGEAVGEIPEGRFTRVDTVDHGDAPYSSDAPAADGCGCAVRVDGSLACWGDDGVEPLEPPAEDFVDVSVHERATRALTAAGSAACRGDPAPQADGAAVEGDFVEVFAGQMPCAPGSEGKLVCWGQEVLHLMPDPPEGQFVDLSMTHGHARAVRVDSELVCSSPRVFVAHGRRPVDGAAGSPLRGRVGRVGPCLCAAHRRPGRVLGPQPLRPGRSVRS